jgi:hypothetical protein
VLFWEAWKAYAHRAGGYQTQVMLTIVYLLILGPAVLVQGLFSTRLLDLNPGPGQTSWVVRGPHEATLEASRRQF